MNKFIFLLFTYLICLSQAQANTVHLGLKIQYETAMSHVEKKDYSIVEILNKISSVLPHSKFLISGHTDMVGSYEVNVELSKGRAENLKTMLIALNISPERIETKWFSYDAPIDTNETVEGRNKNRRVVATVYGLSEEEAAKLTRAAKKSKLIYVIKTESEKVEDFVDQLSAPKITEAIQGPTAEEIEAEKKRLRDLEEQARLAKIQKEEADRLKAELRAERWKAFKEKQRYSLGYEISDNQLKAVSTGFEAIWVTDFNHALSFAYQYKFTSKFWFGFNTSYKLREFRVDNNLIYNWDGNSPDLLNFSLISDYVLSEKINLGLDVKYFEDNFVIYDGLTIDLEKASLISLGLRADYKFLNTNSYSSRLKILIENPILGFGDLDPTGSLSYYGGLDFSLHKVLKNYDLNLGLVYGIRNFENIQNKQTENYLGFEIKIRNKKWF